MNTRLLLSLSLSYLLTTSTIADNNRFKDVEIKPEQLTQTSYMFTGSGGNIGVSAGSDGILIIDNQFAPLADKISAALSKIQIGKPKYVVNTHYHGDHTGGNNLFGIDGVILAHHNVLSRLSGNNSYTPTGLPSITYHEGINIHFNGDNLQLLHMGPGHTDGDSVVLWQDKSVVHMGDLFFKDKFPYIDLNAGGSVKGYRNNVATMIAKIDSKTKVIPGHGSLANKNDLIRFKHMLDDSINWMESKLMAGLSLEDIQAEGIPQKLASWQWKFISEKKWIDTLYNGLSKPK
ncbi:MBL fold metallo-hydrolase [Shewanella sp. D64]|uniref:MBL fold metallo-hydrolase n=1 Tax=unclassified Shewanella TaxID=196818 RepID=UPI0022BA2BBB|nr:MULTISPECIES: MBL fold metallo-hydrolase [unclassified Shewanella]MEC4725716.1 MBL fold metallo-hydrolase [Shewanella sp. D64]MEC4737677.1 MBL fold metallo-hydrolase [Shewanella sp. E94]WBJ93484.1 MBL fold metallo-hydrolase [Shewanella sp. MTB7]